MNYEPLWKALEELIGKLTRKGVTIPRELVDDLKSTKTLINIHKVDPTALHIASEIELYLEKIESNLLYLAESDVGKEYADECLGRIYDARRRGIDEQATVTPRFVSGVPRGEHWVRIKASDLIDDRDLGELLEKLNLTSKPQRNGYLLIYGREEKVKAFIKEVGEKIGKRKK